MAHLVGNEKTISLLLMLALAVTFVASPIYGAQGEKIGVLVIAHGSEEEEWCNAIQQAVDNVELPYTVELGYLEFVLEQDIHVAVKRLERQDIDKIIVVPLFISSFSSHIEEIKYVLGLRETLPKPGRLPPNLTEGRGPPEGSAEGEEPIAVESESRFVLTPALDDHPLVAAILADRLAAISKNPDEEILILVGHGTNKERDLKRWRESFASLARQVKARLDLKDARYGFVGWGTPPVRQVVERAQARGQVIVVPVMMAEGYFTRVAIPQTLEGLTYRYTGQPLTPHPNISRLIELRVEEAISSAPATRELAWAVLIAGLIAALFVFRLFS